MYLDEIADGIKKYISESDMPDGDSNELFRLYAVLLRAKGVNVTYSDIHDAWSSWMTMKDSSHEALVEFDDLDDETQAQDRIFATAVRNAAGELNTKEGSKPRFSEILFPAGPPRNSEETEQTIDLYKIMVASSESLVGRRQAVNTFFLTMNGALITASGLIVRSSDGDKLGWIGIAVLALAGSILCGAWRSLITSFGQLNSGKFQVINTIERYLGTAIYAAEWEALGRGENPKIYRSFTSREIWVPNALLVLHVITVIVGILLGTDLYGFITDSIGPLE